jgi:excinuclease ABC subunit A
MGLGYVTLGQSTSSFSGGEAQRLKLLSLMQEAATERPSCLILDEPTTGLSDSDVAALLKQLFTLARKGHTIIVVEHHLDVLRACDWLIEVGPEAAHRGGQIVYQGEPSGIGGAKGSVTAPFLLKRKNQFSNDKKELS